MFLFGILQFKTGSSKEITLKGIRNFCRANGARNVAFFVTLARFITAYQEMSGAFYCTWWQNWNGAYFPSPSSLSTSYIPFLHTFTHFEQQFWNFCFEMLIVPGEHINNTSIHRHNIISLVSWYIFQESIMYFLIESKISFNQMTCQIYFLIFRYISLQRKIYFLTN